MNIENSSCSCSNSYSICYYNGNHHCYHENPSNTMLIDLNNEPSMHYDILQDTNNNHKYNNDAMNIEPNTDTINFNVAQSYGFFQNYSREQMEEEKPQENKSRPQLKLKTGINFINNLRLNIDTDTLGREYIIENEESQITYDKSNFQSRARGLARENSGDKYDDNVQSSTINSNKIIIAQHVNRLRR
jgi:hypothetical protein